MKRFRLTGFLIISLIGNTINGQSQIAPLWVSNYVTGLGQNGQSNIAVNSLGDVFVSGYNTDTSGYVSSLILKYNSDGILQWSNVYDSTWHINKLTIDNQNNVYFVCSKYKNGNEFICLVKYDSSGAFSWEQFYNDGPYWNYGFDVSVDHSGNIIVGGITKANQFTTLKYNSNGNLLWAALDSSTMGNAKSFIAIDENNNIYYCGRAVDSSYKAKLFKYDSSGNKQWEFSYAGNYNPGSAAPAGLIYKNGFVYVEAFTTNNNSGMGDMAVIKYDTSGIYKWEGIYSAISYYDIPYAIEVDNWGNVYLVGNINPGNCPTDAYVTVRFDSTGSLVWSKSYSIGGCNWDIPHDVISDINGNIYVTGESSDSLGHRNFATIKYDSLGNTIFIARFANTTSSSDAGYSIGLDAIGNIYVSGNNYDGDGSIETLKYSFLTSVKENSKPQNSFLLYPNPFKNTIKIDANINLTNFTFKLFDIAHREVFVTNISDSNILLPNIEEGIYFYQIWQGRNFMTKGKLIKSY